MNILKYAIILLGSLLFSVEMQQVHSNGWTLWYIGDSQHSDKNFSLWYITCHKSIKKANNSSDMVIFL